MTETENPDPLLNRKEAARYIRNEPQTLANWVCTKRYKLNIVKKAEVSFTAAPIWTSSSNNP